MKKTSLLLRDQFYLFLILKNIYVYFYFISIQASIRNVKSMVKISSIFLAFLENMNFKEQKSGVILTSLELIFDWKQHPENI